MTRLALTPLAFVLFFPDLAQAQVPATQAVVQEAARQGVNATSQAVQQQAQRVVADAAARAAAKADKPKDNPGPPQNLRQ